MKTAAIILNLMLAVAAGALEHQSTVDSGGCRSSDAGATCTNDGSIGGIGGVARAEESSARAGYIGQLTEAASLSISASPSSVGESVSTQLGGSAVMDDDSVTLLAGSEIRWDAAEWPLSGIDSDGTATAALVYMDTSASVSGSYLDAEGSGSVLVEDTIADNFGSYAGDGLPDSWQYQYFGLDNPDAAPDKDPSGVGQNNLFKYEAGLDPTDPASVFRLRITGVPDQPNRKQLIFSPCLPDRSYTPICSTSLIADAIWSVLSNSETSDNGDERTVTDTASSETLKFYRIDIKYP